MHGFAIRQKYNTQSAPVHGRDSRPSADAAILLRGFLFGMFDHVLYPLQPDHGAVRTLAHGLEIPGEFHATKRNECAPRRQRRKVSWRMTS